MIRRKIIKGVDNKEFKDGSRGESEMAPPEIAHVYCISCGGVQIQVIHEICEDCLKNNNYPGDIYGY